MRVFIENLCVRRIAAAIRRLGILRAARACGGALTLLLMSPSVAAVETPNIIWIIGEDLGPELGCYGHPEVRTPNLDRLASDGVRYTRAFTVAPVCSASRSAFVTGMYQTSIGAHNHRSHRDDGFQLPSGVRVITDWLRDAGVYTANVRQLSMDPKEPFFRGTGKTDWNFAYTGRPFDSDRWDDLKSHQPFYAQINFSETHRGSDWNRAHLDVAKPADPAKVQLPPYYPDHPEVRADWAQYLNAVMALDKKVGYVLDRLEADGLADRTVVVFLGDHGRAMIRGKQWPYDSGLHIPLIIRWPKAIPVPSQFKPGTVNGQLIASIDLAATTLAIAGVPPPLTMQGRVFLGAGAGPERKHVFGGRDRGDETVDRIRTVRTKRYRYLKNFYPEQPFLQLNRYKEFSYPVISLMRDLHARGELNATQARLLAPTRPAEELYDLEADPFETNNLADAAENQETLRTLRSVLESWIVESNDQGRVAESAEIHEQWEAQMKANYDEKIRDRDLRLHRVVPTPLP